MTSNLTLKDVYIACTPVIAQWKDLGVRLGIEMTSLDKILADNPHSTRDCLSAMINTWLIGGGDSDPSWDILCKALSGINQGIANRISQEHGCNSMSPAVSHSCSRSDVPPAFLTQSCGCGKCTIKEWITSRQACKKIYYDEKPKLLVVNPSSNQRLLKLNNTYDRQAMLARNTHLISSSFDVVSAETWRALRRKVLEKKYSISDIAFELQLSLRNPFPILQLEDLQHQFHSLRVSWYNFDVLRHLAGVFLADNDDLMTTWNNYLCLFKDYCFSRNLKEFVNVFFTVENENVFLLEIDDHYNDFTLSDIDSLSKSLGSALGVPPVSLHLVTVGQGSVVIYFYYCYSDYLKLFQSLTEQQLKEISQIKEYTILSLTDLEDRFTYDNIQKYKEVAQVSTEDPDCESKCAIETETDSQLIELKEKYEILEKKYEALEKKNKILKKIESVKSQEIKEKEIRLKERQDLVLQDKKQIEEKYEILKKLHRRKSQEIEEKDVRLKENQDLVLQDKKQIEALTDKNLELCVFLEENQAKVMDLKEKDDVFQLWKKVNTPSSMSEDEALLAMKSSLVKDLSNAITTESIIVELRHNGLAVCNNGDILATTQDTHEIAVFDRNGVKVRSIGKKGTNEGDFMFPTGLAVTSDGHILVTDHHRLQKLTFDGVCVKSVGSDKSGSGQLQFNVPGGIAVHPNSGQIFVTEFHRIQVLNEDLTFSCFITLQKDDKQFKKPQDICIDGDGYLYVAEYDNHCITKLTTTGQYIARFNCQHGPPPGQLSNPSSLVLSSNNLLYVCEWGNHRISVFDTQGRFLHCFGKHGRENKEFDHPRSMTIDKRGNLYVNDRGNKRIVILYMQ